MTPDPALRSPPPNAAPEIAISVDRLTKSFGGRVVVKNLTMKVRRGQI